MDNIHEADWDTNFINNLPDSCFAFIEPGGNKDESGKTIPRTKRHFPFKNLNGEVDLPHLRNALARAPQSPFGDKAMPALKAAAKKMKIGEYSESWKGGEGYFQSIVHISEAFFKDEKNKPNDEKREVVLPLLKEGWGNPVDKNYYTLKALSESASYLQSRRKMYLNHPTNESEDRDMRDWAASIKETWVEKLPDGKHITMGRIKVYDNWLWERIKSAPEEIGTSVLGRGKAMRSVVDGKDANIIESIEYVKSCDFVDYPGNTPFGMVYFVENQKSEDNKNKNEEEKEMRIEEITLSILKENRSDLVSEIEKVAITDKDKKITELEFKIKEQEQETLILKNKLDTFEVKEKINQKTNLINKMLQESKLPETAKTEVFKEVLMSLEESKKTVDGKEVVISVEEKIKMQIEDRLTVLGITENKVINMGKGVNNNSKEDEEKIQESFNSKFFDIQTKKDDKK